MIKIEELSRDNAVKQYKNQGYSNIDGRIIKGEEYKQKLYSLFLTRYKQTLTDDKIQKLQVYYADMLEIVTTMMSMTETKFVNMFEDTNQQAFNWYKNLSPSKSKLKEARIDLIQKFYELLSIKTEAIRDQLNEMVVSLYNVIEKQNLQFVNVEKTRKIMREKLGGFSKGIYIESVSKIRIKAKEYSI